MRTSILTLIVALGILATSDALAQTSFGVRAGLNVATIGGSDVDDAEARLGLLAGAYADVPVTPSVSIQPEVLFSQKGANLADDFESGSLSITYLDIPVLVKYNIPTGTNLMPSVYVGPQLGVKLSEQFRVGDETLDFDLIRSTDLGLTIGGDIGARLAGRQQRFGVGLRYTLGLTDIFDADAFNGDGPSPTIDAKNRVFAVSAYFTF